MNKTELKRRLNEPTTLREPSEQKEKWLRISSLAANLAQIGLLLLALFGYVYTVRPVYQRDLLEEQVSKAELDLARTNRDLATVRANYAATDKLLSDVQERLKSSTDKLNGQLLEFPRFSGHYAKPA